MTLNLKLLGNKQNIYSKAFNTRTTMCIIASSFLADEQNTGRLDIQTYK